MADEIKRVQVRIGSMSYALVSAEDEQYTRKVGARADEMIQRVMQNNPQLGQHQATVLALVNAVDDLTRMYGKAKNEDNRQQEIDRQISEVRHELQRQRELNWDMKKEILELRQVCREYETELAKLRRGGSARAEDSKEFKPLQVSDVAWQEHEDDQAQDGKTKPDQSQAASSDEEISKQEQLSPEALEAAEPERKQAQQQQPGHTADNTPKPVTDETKKNQDGESEAPVESGSLKQTHFDDFLRQDDSKDNH